MSCLILYNTFLNSRGKGSVDVHLNLRTLIEEVLVRLQWYCQGVKVLFQCLSNTFVHCQKIFQCYKENASSTIEVPCSNYNNLGYPLLFSSACYSIITINLSCPSPCYSCLQRCLYTSWGEETLKANFFQLLVYADQGKSPKAKSLTPQAEGRERWKRLATPIWQLIELIKGNLQGIPWVGARWKGSLRHLAGAKELYRKRAE